MNTCVNCLHCYNLDPEETDIQNMRFECRVSPPTVYIFPVQQKGPLGNIQQGFTKVSSYPIPVGS